MSHEDSDDNAEDNDAIHEAAEEEEEIVFHLSTGNVLSGQSTEQPNTNQQDYASQHRAPSIATKEPGTVDTADGWMAKLKYLHFKSKLLIQDLHKKRTKLFYVLYNSMLHCYSNS